MRNKRISIKKSHFLHMSAGIDYSFGHANTVGYVTFIKDK